MAYAAYLDFQVANIAEKDSEIEVIDITVNVIDACAVRHALAQLKDASVLRSEVTVQHLSAPRGDVVKVRMTLMYFNSGYASLLHCLLRCVLSGEIGCRRSWSAHMQRCNLFAKLH